MEAMVERIAPRKEKTLAVYGAADFPHAMKGVQITYVPEACRLSPMNNDHFVIGFP